MKIYMAKKGDSLWTLAEKFRLHPDALFELNPHIINPEMLEPGVKVKIPIPPSPLEQPPMEFLEQYHVKQGDTLWKLSKSWNVPLKALIAVNPQLRNPNVLSPGEIVHVPKLTAEIASTQPLEQEAEKKSAPAVKVNVKANTKKTKEKEKIVENADLNEVAIATERPFMKHGSGWIERPYPHEAKALFNSEHVFWGDANPSFTSSEANPFETYTVDPRIKLPAYPDYDVEAQNAEVQVEDARSDTSGKALKRPEAKPSGKSKTGGKQAKAKAASLPAPSSKRRGKRYGKPVVKSSRPWTNI